MRWSGAAGTFATSALQKAQKSSNAAGRAVAFMAMAPIKAGHETELAAYLQGLGEQSPFARLPRTHFARFVIVDDFHHDPTWGQPHEDHLPGPVLVLTAVIDGPADSDRESYLEQFCALPEAMEVYAHCIGETGIQSIGETLLCDWTVLTTYLLHNEVKGPSLFYAPYGDATVQEVKAALAAFPADAAPEWANKTPVRRLHVAQATRIAADTYDREHAGCPVGTLFKRDQHAEEYGTVHGRLAVRLEDVPSDMRHGLFARDGDYDALMRFSPNQSLPWPLCPPVGLGLKVIGAAGDLTQDFLFGATTDRFFAEKEEDGVDLVRARANGRRGLIGYFFGLDPRKWRLLELRIMIATLSRRVQDLLAGTMYFSQTAIMCGPSVVKVGVQAPEGKRRPWSLRRPDLAARLRATLAGEGVTLSLMLQRQGPDDPADDPRISWAGPWEQVATIFLPAQEPTSGEHLTFTLGHHLPDHEPVGGINADRVGVYEAISHKRHGLNGVPEREPTPAGTDADG